MPDQKPSPKRCRFNALQATLLAVAAGIAGPGVAQNFDLLLQEQGRQQPRLRYSDPTDLGSLRVEPYIDLSPRGEPPIPDLERSVIYLFAANCSASRGVHDNIMQWGATLPPGWLFRPIPVVVDGHVAPALVGFAGRSEAQSGGLFDEGAYWRMMYSEVLDRGASTEDILGILGVAVAAGADRDHLTDLVVERGGAHTATEAAADLMARYRPQHTPSLVIADRWLTHPDLVGSNPLTVLRVANALVSMAIHEERGNTGPEHERETP